MFKGFWLENKEFLLLAGGGLLVFFVVNNYFIESYVGGAESIRKESQKKHQAVVLLHKGLKNGWIEEKLKVKAFQEHELELKKSSASRRPSRSKVRAANSRSGSTRRYPTPGRVSARRPTGRGSGCRLP